MKRDEPLSFTVSRRGFGAAVAGTAVAGLATPGAAGAAELAAGWGDAGPVVGFHADAPWLDPSGRDKPYRPPHANGAFAPDTESLARLGHFL